MYTIYHIPERTKIGVTDNLKRRMIEHKWTGTYEVIEEHTDGWLAGDRELELQKEYGYPVDTSHYMITLQKPTKEGRQKGGATQGAVNKESGYMSALGKRTQFNNISRNVTYQQAAEIKEKHNGKYGDTKKLAEEYNCSKSTISRIIHNVTYNGNKRLPTT